MYIKRHIETVLKKAKDQTKVVLLTGSRQTGKTTAIRKVFPDYEYVTLDNDNDRYLAMNDPTLFLKDRSFPLIIDEVQYVKELMLPIKLHVDSHPQKGRIFLTGSQTFDLLSLSSETLAGRISILELPPLSLRELYSEDDTTPFLPTDDYLERRKNKRRPYDNIWNTIHRGMMPELTDKERDWDWFYRDYLRTYIERDIRRIVNVRDELKFHNFMVSIAARSAQLLNCNDIAGDVGVDIKTVQHWLSVVAASGLIKIIHPYYSNVVKRAIKTPKLYFMDTGLMCYLVGWRTPETARNGAMSGAIFETFVVSEIIKSYMNAGRDIHNIYFYRDKDKREIDLIIDEQNTLYPIEIKKGMTVDRDWIKNFSVLSKIKDRKIGNGAVICQTDRLASITESVKALPMEYV